MPVSCRRVAVAVASSSATLRRLAAELLASRGLEVVELPVVDRLGVRGLACGVDVLVLDADGVTAPAVVEDVLALDVPVVLVTTRAPSGHEALGRRMRAAAVVAWEDLDPTGIAGLAVGDAPLGAA